MTRGLSKKRVNKSTHSTERLVVTLDQLSAIGILPEIHATADRMIQQLHESYDDLRFQLKHLLSVQRTLEGALKEKPTENWEQVLKQSLVEAQTLKERLLKVLSQSANEVAAQEEADADDNTFYRLADSEIDNHQRYQPVSF